MDPSTNPDAPPGMIIATGLPTEAAYFAKDGYRVQAFEARQKGYDQVFEHLSQLSAPKRSRVQLHQLALSNNTGTTEIFDAEDRSSLLKSAVEEHELALKKFERTGNRRETVPVTTLDHHFRSSISSSTAPG
jgi:hypothetical protein